MTDNNARERLLELIDQKAFYPVLEASPEDYPGEWDRQKLLQAQDVTRSTQQRYHQSYTSASEVVQNFHRDLISEEALKVQAELSRLGLPTLQDVKYEFNSLVRELGVKG